MTANLALIIAASVTVGAGVYLALERSLTRVLIGLVLISNGVNLMLIVASGPAGEAPLAGDSEAAAMSDALPQALVLTAIVITLGTTAFILAMAYRSWQVNGSDDVQDDLEDALIRRLAAADETSDTYGLSQRGELASDERWASAPDEDAP